MAAEKTPDPFFVPIRVRAPSRLHFGLFSIGKNAGRQYGGVGVMIDEPHLELEIRSASQFSASGPLASRVTKFAESWMRWHRLGSLPECSICVKEAPRPHCGLGVGTQLGLSVGAGLNACFRRNSESVAELARCVGRGLRSAVGTYGFRSGGLIAEKGKLPDECISPLWSRVEIPDSWRFVVFVPNVESGLHGSAELAAFEELPPVSTQQTDRMISETENHLLPAIERALCDELGESVYKLGVLSGDCFRSTQGGSFHSARSSDLVQKIRNLGVSGVGQSSWGPSIFAIVDSSESANRLVVTIKQTSLVEDTKILVAPPCNSGATVEEIREPD